MIIMTTRFSRHCCCCCFVVFSCILITSSMICHAFVSSIKHHHCRRRLGGLTFSSTFGDVQHRASSSMAFCTNQFLFCFSHRRQHNHGFVPAGGCFTSKLRMMPSHTTTTTAMMMCPSSSLTIGGSHGRRRPQKKQPQKRYPKEQGRRLRLGQSDNDLDDDDMPTKTTDLSNYRTSFSMPPNSEDDSSTSRSSSGSSTSYKNTLLSPQSSNNNSKDPFLQWSSLGLWSELVHAVTKDMELEAPTQVQRLVIPSLLQEPPQHTAFLAATGSGKTLAYLLPLLQQLKNQEVFGSTSSSSTSPSKNSSSGSILWQQQQQQQQQNQRPRLLILAPTRELVAQITKVVKQLCHSLKLSSQGLTGATSLGQERQRLERHVDVVVATPGRLLQHWKAHHLYLGQVQHVVLDEMDTMLEQGFQGELREILYPLLYQGNDDLQNHPADKQQQQSQQKSLDTKPDAPRLVLTSATMTQAVQKLLGVVKANQQQQQPKEQQIVISARKHYVKDPTQPKPTMVFPQPMQIITAPGLHKAVPRLEQVFINVQNVDKLSLLVDIVSRSHDPKRQRQHHVNNNNKAPEPYLTLVFCNTVSSCRAAQHALTEAGIDSLNYHGELNSDMRADNLQQFAQASCPILVATDLAARGLDVPQVQHVVLFDFPLNPLDYLHRSGRTARGNRIGGKLTALVAKRDQVLAKAIEQAVLRGLPLDGLTSRKSDYQPGTGRGGGGGGQRQKLVLKTTKQSKVGENPRRKTSARLRTTTPGIFGTSSSSSSSSIRSGDGRRSKASSSRRRSASTTTTTSSKRKGVATRRGK